MRQQTSQTRSYSWSLVQLGLKVGLCAVPFGRAIVPSTEGGCAECGPSGSRALMQEAGAVLSLVILATVTACCCQVLRAQTTPIFLDSFALSPRLQLQALL